MIPLSEAIRLGSMMKPQYRGAFEGEDKRVRKTCALGAALDAISRLGTHAEGFNLWRDILGKFAVHPMTGRILPIFYIITSLNDAEGWTREQIADWVETVEKGTYPAIDNPFPRYLSYSSADEYH